MIRRRCCAPRARRRVPGATDAPPNPVPCRWSTRPMAKQARSWKDILVKRGVIGPDQLKDAERRNEPLEEALVKLRYAEPDDIMKAKAEEHGLDFVELREIEIPASVIELIPESLARENVVMPLAQENGTIKVIMHDPMNFDALDK